jgi:hypothetical protein
VRKLAKNARTCLEVVGMTVADLEQAAAAELSEGSAYLVGSLASGLGNAGSDVDIHIVRAGIAGKTGPFMRFVGDAVVDIEHYPADWVSQTVVQARGHALADIGVGHITLGEAPEPAMGWHILRRWLHAVPLKEDQHDVFTADEASTVLPLLVRSAYDELIVSVALAQLADAAAEPLYARQYLWRDASRRLLELRCRAAGDVTNNKKWLPARVRRLGLADPAETSDEAAFWSVADRCGLRRPASVWNLTRLAVAVESQPVSLGGETWLLNRHGRLLNQECEVTGGVYEVVEKAGAARVLTALRRAECDISVDDDALGKELG